MRLIKRSTRSCIKANSPNLGFLDLPYEIRFEIYQNIFTNSHVRLFQEYRLDHYHLLKRHLCLQLEGGHNLLRTCRHVYNECNEFLRDHPVDVIIEGVDTEKALWEMGSKLKNDFLRHLIASAPKLILSTPAGNFTSPLTLPCLIPNFVNLKEVEVFGFFPDLNNWLLFDRAISVGWPHWNWQFCWWKTPSFPTWNRKIQLSHAARVIHRILSKNPNEIKVRRAQSL